MFELVGKTLILGRGGCSDRFFACLRGKVMSGLVDRLSCDGRFNAILIGLSEAYWLFTSQFLAERFFRRFRAAFCLCRLCFGEFCFLW
jgi:hypothetical protein